MQQHNIKISGFSTTLINEKVKGNLTDISNKNLLITGNIMYDKTAILLDMYLFYSSIGFKCLYISANEDDIDLASKKGNIDNKRIYNTNELSKFLLQSKNRYSMIFIDNINTYHDEEVLNEIFLRYNVVATNNNNRSKKGMRYLYQDFDIILQLQSDFSKSHIIEETDNQFYFYTRKADIIKYRKEGNENTKELQKVDLFYIK